MIHCPGVGRWFAALLDSDIVMRFAERAAIWALLYDCRTQHHIVHNPHLTTPGLCVRLARSIELSVPSSTVGATGNMHRERVSLASNDHGQPGSRLGR